MNKELDLNGVRIYSNTKDDVKDAIDLIGQEVYMSVDADFENYYKFRLIGVRFVEDDPFVFVGSDYDAYKYFILAKDAKFKEEKEKKLRPFKDLKEFRCATGRGIGDIVTFKRKDNTTEYNLLFSGCSSKRGEVLLYLGQGCFTFKELCDDYLFYNANYNEWLPFGVEE